MSPLPLEPGHALEQYRAYLECLTFIRLDPRLWRRFGWSDIVNHTLLEASHELQVLQGLPEADRKRRLRRMMLHNLLQRIEHERAQKRDVRRDVALDDALAGSSCNLQRGLAADSPGPDGRAEAAEEGAQLASALTRLPEREREALILQKHHGRTLAQIAAHLGCTTGAVAGLHARALKRLREILTDAGEE
jgi:RNA polymerase sigma-70 factor (subfamily 1)